MKYINKNPVTRKAINDDFIDKNTIDYLGNTFKNIFIISPLPYLFIV